MGALRILGEEHCRENSEAKEAGAPVASGNNAHVVARLHGSLLDFFKKRTRNLQKRHGVNLSYGLQGWL